LVARTRPRLSGRAALYARHSRHDAPWPAVDDAPVRGLRHGGGHESALPLSAFAGPNRPIHGLRSADADGLRFGSPAFQGEVGKCGVAISSLADMEVLFDQIPLADVTTSMTINSPAAVIWAMYLAVA